MVKLKDISQLNTVSQGRYIVAEDGPDSRSTYVECWGQNARYSYRAVAASDNLAEAASLVSRSGVVMDRDTGKPISQSRLRMIDAQ